MKKTFLLIGTLAGIVTLAPAYAENGNGRGVLLSRTGDGLIAARDTLRDRLGNADRLTVSFDGDALRDAADDARDRREERREDRRDRLEDSRDRLEERTEAITDKIDDLRDTVVARDGDAKLEVVRTLTTNADGSLDTALRSGLRTTVSLKND